MKKLINFILLPYKRWKIRREMSLQLAELRKKDPFIYK